MNNRTIITIVIVLIIIIGIFIAVQKTNAPSTSPVVEQATSTNTTNTTVNNDATQASVVPITISGFAFNPKTVAVKKGTTVTWTNEDTVRHTVTGVNGGPSSELFGKGETYSYTFNDVGTFDYYCKPHPYMKGTIVVSE